MKAERAIRLTVQGEGGEANVLWQPKEPLGAASARAAHRIYGDREKHVSGHRNSHCASRGGLARGRGQRDAPPPICQTRHGAL